MQVGRHASGEQHLGRGFLVRHIGVLETQRMPGQSCGPQKLAQPLAIPGRRRCIKGMAGKDRNHAVGHLLDGCPVGHQAIARDAVNGLRVGGPVGPGLRGPDEVALLLAGYEDPRDLDGIPVFSKR